mmetsp:Transcript_35081/g.46165  ORF Transcript_35081/g.46165 Transcript_35081/m.46165 type:complete len:118 (+) Transcript_35081:239-592(+)
MDRATESLNIANNVALTLYDIYSRDALENYLGFWRSPTELENGESEWESEEGSDASEEQLSETGADKKTQSKTKLKTTKNAAAKKSKKVAEAAPAQIAAQVSGDSDDWGSDSDEKND